MGSVISVPSCVFGYDQLADHDIDTGMLTKNVDAVHGGTSEQYAADLIVEIKASSTLAHVDYLLITPHLCAERLFRLTYVGLAGLHEHN